MLKIFNFIFPNVFKNWLVTFVHRTLDIFYFNRVQWTHALPGKLVLLVVNEARLRWITDETSGYRLSPEAAPRFVKCHMASGVLFNMKAK